MRMENKPENRIYRVKSKLKDGTVVQYHYLFRGGPRFWSSKDGSAEDGPAYWDAYAAAMAKLPEHAPIFRKLLRLYLKSRHFQSLSPRTQSDYIYSISRPKVGIDAKWGSAPITLFERPVIRREVYRWQERVFTSDRGADHAVGLLTAIVTWAVDRGELKNNHLSGMKKRYKSDRAHLRWLPMEIDAFLSGRVGEMQLIEPADEITSRILTLAVETGLRPVDQIRVSRGHIVTIQGRRLLQIIPSKTKRRTQIQVSVPVTEGLAHLIDSTPKSQMVLLCDDTGKPYARPESLSQRIMRRREKLTAAADQYGLEPPVRKELHFYDARSSAAERLYSAGADLREIAGVMGWSIETAARMIEVYTEREGAHVIGLFDKLRKRE